MGRLEPDTAPAFKALELDDVHLLLKDLAKGLVLTPEDLETGKYLRHIAHADDDFGFSIEEGLGHLQFG